MGNQVHGMLLIQAQHADQQKRLSTYFDPSTRPDDPDEVPEQESDWIDLFEFIEDPQYIELIDETVLVVGFCQDERDMGEFMHELSVDLMEVLVVKRIIVCEFISDEPMVMISDYNAMDTGRRNLWNTDEPDQGADAVTPAQRKMLQQAFDLESEKPEEEDRVKHTKALSNLLVSE